MVTTTQSFTSTNVLPEDALSGVVKVVADGFYGTGTLLYDGRAVLTAAHVVEGVDAADMTVWFEDESIRYPLNYSVSHSLIFEGYDALNSNGDLAILWLDASVPAEVSRFNLYHAPIVAGDAFLMAGFGLNGTGEYGAVDSYAAPNKMKASNTFDLNSADFSYRLEATMAWEPLEGAIWAADFDSGLVAQDNLGVWSGHTHLGLGEQEGLIAQGDSGGPALIEGQIAGVASYLAALPAGGVETDVDAWLNSSYGELGFWQSVNYFGQWIDQTVRHAWQNVPATPAEVVKRVVEGDSGTSYAYFMVSFNGDRASISGALSVDYRTLEGTARAGEDYIPVNGTLVFYANDTQLVIPVEIIGDALAEPDETFYLEVYNPVGAQFVNGAVSLVAVRTIIDNDVV